MWFILYVKKSDNRILIWICEWLSDLGSFVICENDVCENVELYVNVENGMRIVFFDRWMIIWLCVCNEFGLLSY